ncbi:porin [Mesorhizobium microcysteis]|uniref:Porin n=1 Tax=Neoaquamicrobium microcysteis TaxID=2682781 RepID=A0A5D4H119_9HYPH|nr:porin [Mesorhizobium microcysteis]TYR34247.1 porin [Mesorhizobium microcysteis]
MNIKGLFLGQAAALLAVSGAQAADAIIMAEPEPMEYVRVCDVYGAGFFYIPGTETCLQIGGYMRYRMDYVKIGGQPYEFSKTARFAPSFDARNETEWGTLRSFAHLFFEWNSVTGNDVYADMAFIELQTASGSFLIGKNDTPYARFFGGYGADGDLDGDYGSQIYNSGELSYTYTGANGFSAVIAAIESIDITTGAGTGKFQPNIEAGAIYEQDWGSIGGIVGYDNPDDSWGAKGVARFNFDPFSVGVHVLYSSSESGVYGAANPDSGETSEWSVLAHAGVQVSEKVSVNGYFQWFDATTSSPSAYQVKGGLGLTPVENLEILPEVRYTKVSGGGDAWEGVLRFTRSF